MPALAPQPTATPTTDAQTLRAFLNAYWLRPENAFWMTLRSRTLATVDWSSPAIDISCGDGVFSFLHAGGAFAESFDVFAATGHLDRVKNEHADMFDVPASDYAPPITRRPARTIDVGSDLKPALLSKAETLGFYERFLLHDNNRPLPLDDAEFETVYCNSAYWLREIDAFLGELRRITRPGGQIVLHVKLADMHDYTLEAYRSQLGERFLEIIGRGRMECWPTVATRGEWEERFTRAGLNIVEATPFVTRTHAQIWDVGLRPIAPLLVRMTRELSPTTRESIKRDWVALFEELLAPLSRPDFDLFADASEPAEIQYVLSH